MRALFVVCASVVACSNPSPPITYDGHVVDGRIIDGVVIDAPSQPPNDLSVCYPSAGSASCVGSEAAGYTGWQGGGTSMTLCGAPPVSATATCTSGCAIQVSVSGLLRSDDVAPLAAHPGLLCAETAEVVAGDACNWYDPAVQFWHSNQADAAIQNAVPCFPTRARLDADGTVSSQSYLKCQSGHCVTTSAPTVAGYLQACDSAVVAQHAGQTGAVAIPPAVANRNAACLLASDASGTASGTTIQCIGDWECPDHALCDDQIANLGSGAMAVCKPGPRGTLTRAMLGQ